MLRQFVPLSSRCTSRLRGDIRVSMAPAGMETGKFVNYTCEKGGFQARWNPDSRSVRVRSQHGAAELSAGADGSYSGDGFLMRTTGPDGVSLTHEGKVLGSNARKRSCERMTFS